MDVGTQSYASVGKPYQSHSIVGCGPLTCLDNVDWLKLSTSKSWHVSHQLFHLIQIEILKGLKPTSPRIKKVSLQMPHALMFSTPQRPSSSQHGGIMLQNLALLLGVRSPHHSSRLFFCLHHPYIYMHAVVLLSGPSLAF